MKIQKQISKNYKKGILKNLDIKGKEESTGITLIALVITIIILLILAGISIASLKESGLFEKAKQAREKSSISETKEKIELAIMDLRIQEELKGNSLTKDSLIKLNNKEIVIGSTEKFPVEAISNRHKFQIDKNFNVIYIGEIDGTIITYTTNPDGYTNQNEIVITININNPKGIESIEINGDIMDGNGVTEKIINYTVTANGKYSINVIDIEGNTTSTDIEIDKIDKLAPKDFEIKVEDISLELFTIIANTEDESEKEGSVKSGIEKYEYYVKDKEEDENIEYTKYESNEISGLVPGKTYKVYVIAYDKAGNEKKSKTIEVTTVSIPFPPRTKIMINEETATKKVLNYPVLTLDGMMNCILEPNIGDNVTVEIISEPKENIDYYYSLDSGNTWNKYTDIINTDYKGENYIQVKSIYKNNIESNIKIVKRYIKDKSKACLASNSLTIEAYDDNFDTYQESCGNNREKYFEIDPECWGKYLSINSENPQNSGHGNLSMGSSYNSAGDIIGGEYIYNLSGNTDWSQITKCVLILEGSYWAVLTSGTSNYGISLNIYEVWSSYENLTGIKHSNDNMP